MAEMEAGLPWTIPKLPVIDEEYFETIAVYDSVLRAKGHFVVVELGARWGTWGSRAVAFLKHVNAMPYKILFVESLPLHCAGLKDVMSYNDIKYELKCEYANAELFAKWAPSVSHIDLLDVDIQGAEIDLFRDASVKKLVDLKVKRLIVGTHNPAIHEAMRKLFEGWIVQIDTPYSRNTKCVKDYLRSESKVDRNVFDRLIQEGCYENSIYGKIANWDGELILDNPRFSNRDILFPGDALVKGTGDD